MKIYRKTYGAKGLLEWDLALRAGKALVRIRFQGGSMGSNGVIPAKFTTEDAAVQRILEGSRYFRSGLVYLHGRPVETEESKSRAFAQDSFALTGGSAAGASFGAAGGFGVVVGGGEECLGITVKAEGDEAGGDSQPGGGAAWGGLEDYV